MERWVVEDEVRAPVLTRSIGWLLAVLGVALVIGGASAARVDAGPLVVGIIFTLLGPTATLARARCDGSGVVYWNLRRFQVSVAEATRVEVESRGWIGSFPTLVIYRASGRPLVLRAVQDFRTEAGRLRTEDRAAAWRRLLKLAPLDSA